MFIVRLINQGSYFGTFFLYTIHGQVSHLRELRRTYKTFIKRVGEADPSVMARATYHNCYGCYGVYIFIDLDVNNSLMASNTADHVTYFIFKSWIREA